MSPESPVQHGVVEKTLDLWSHGKQPWSEFESADIRPNLVDNAAAPEAPETVYLAMQGSFWKRVSQGYRF